MSGEEKDKLDTIITGLKHMRGEEKKSDLVKVVEYFTSTEGIRGKTKITAKKRNMIHVYDLMHKKHPTWGLQDAATNLAQLFISEDGESRKGTIDLFRGVLETMQQKPMQPEEAGRNEPGIKGTRF